MALVTVQRSPTPSTTSSSCVSECDSVEDERLSQPRSISESFLTVKGAALFLPRGKSPTSNDAPRISQRRNKHTGDLQKHLQTMFTVLRPEDTIRLAVRLESAYPQVTRYMVVISTNGRQDTEESIVLGVDFVSSDSCCSVGMVLPLWSDTLIHLDGDGGFSVSTVNRVHVFKPVSVQAMWSALQSLHKACEVARCHNYYPGSLFLTWVSYYQSRISSSQFCINEWNAMQDVESHRANSPILFTDLPTERERTERLIKMRLREIMMQKDLENVTSKEIRTELEMQMACNLRDFKEFIDNEMIVILGQMDSPTEIFDHVFLGSEWNASNLEELQNSGVRYILNVTREIDNFFPGTFEYHNIRVYDEEATNLLEYWNDTYKFITKAKKAGAKCLVHCKMGVSRSASTVIAYAMKEYGWDLDTAFDYVKERRAVTKPNPSFMKQLEEYQGILLASKQRHNKLWRSHSDGELSDPPESMCKPSSPPLGRSDSHNNNTPSLHHFLGVAVLQALGAVPEPSSKPGGGHESGPVAAAVEVEIRPLLLPRPRAATVVPEERLRVAVTVPVALPHPPPSLHVLPPTPELHRARRGAPCHLPLSSQLEPAQASGLEETSAPGSGDSDLPDESSSSSALGAPTPPPHLTLSDDNNNPSEQPSGGSSSRSIDFFTARERFLGLMQDGPLQAQPEPPPPPRTPQSPGGEEDPELQIHQVCSPSSPDAITPSDGGVSVRHIVTEIEAISQSASGPSAPSCCSPAHSPLPPQPQEELESSEASLTPPSPPSSPPAVPSGSVRRATEQLEQRLKAARGPPLHSPSSHQPLTLLSLCFQSLEPPPASFSATRPDTQGEPWGVGHEPKGGAEESQRHGSSGTASVSHISRASGAPSSSADNSARALAPGPAAARCVALEGVTLRESHTEDAGEGSWACGSEAQSRLARSSQDLERIQQTLQELQAFLQEAQELDATGAAMDTEAKRHKDAMQYPKDKQEAGRGPAGPPGWHRTTELEARLRQAGLTPPSLMKRSASLAKLDCLELSANDLSDLDPRPHAAAASSSRSPPPTTPHPDDSWKKQKVLSPNTPGKPDPLPDAPPRLPRPPSEEEGEGGACCHQSRGPSLRRARKASAERRRAVALLYNTM